MRILWPSIVLFYQVSGVISTDSCKRPCDHNTIPMTCTYHLVADYYYTNQTDCLGCSRGVESDCSRKYCIPGDGSFRMVKAFNYSIPGPTIEVCEFDTIIVYVKNRLETETTSVHWHGMHQFGTPDMDGVPMVTQRPILSNELYTYKFKASPPGTHFYRSTTGFQRSEGLFGKFIVREYGRPTVAYNHDVHSLALLEWTTIPMDDIGLRYLRDGKIYEREYNRTIVVDGYGHTGPTGVPPARYVVERGLRYRFRVIHAGSAICPMEVSIDNHTLLMFNSDGYNFKPATVDSFFITNGERLDFILHANKAVDQYTIRINTYSACNVRGYAILQYKGATNKSIDYDHTPILNRRLNCIVNYTPGCIYYNELQHVPRVYDDRDLHTKPEVVSLYFNAYQIAQERFNGTIVAPTLRSTFINKIGFIPPPKTLLCNEKQKTCNESNAEPLQQCTHLTEVTADKMIEILLMDESRGSDFSHPYHLHGYSFMIMSQGKVEANITTRDQVMAMYKNGQLPRSKNPIVKDTMPVPSAGYAVLRFRANNYGYWLLQCQGNNHLERGLQMVIKTSKVPKIPESCTCFV